MTKGNKCLRKYAPSLLFLLFEAVAVTLWLTKDNLFYLLNFSYIGGCLAAGTVLFTAGKRYARHFVQLAVGSYMLLYGHVHNTREWKLVEKWKNEQWAMGIPSRLINVGCMMDYMRYTPRTLTELLDANPMPEIARDRKDGSAVESAEQQNKRERTWDLNEGYTAEKTE